jgi:hypothetical protein
MSQQWNIRLNYNRPQVQTFVYKAGSPEAPVDLTNYTAEMRLTSLDDTDAAITPLTTSNGGISLGTTNGLVTINVPTAINSFPESGSHRFFLVTPTGGNVFVTSGTVIVEDKP